MDYNKLYERLVSIQEWYHTNQDMIEDVFDISKVFTVAIFATTFDINIIPTNSSIDTWLKIIEIMIKIAVLIYTVYKIIEIHKRFKSDKKRWRRNSEQ